jgi:hypothetical protein
MEIFLISLRRSPNHKKQIAFLWGYRQPAQNAIKIKLTFQELYSQILMLDDDLFLDGLFTIFNMEIISARHDAKYI